MASVSFCLQPQIWRLLLSSLVDCSLFPRPSSGGDLHGTGRPRPGDDTTWLQYTYFSPCSLMWDPAWFCSHAWLLLVALDCLCVASVPLILTQSLGLLMHVCCLSPCSLRGRITKQSLAFGSWIAHAWLHTILLSVFLCYSGLLMCGLCLQSKSAIQGAVHC